MLGFMLGKARVEKAFNRGFASQFNIHRSRQKFPDNGIDNFSAMAEKGIYIIDRVVQEQLKGGVGLKKDVWYMRGR